MFTKIIEFSDVINKVDFAAPTITIITKTGGHQKLSQSLGHRRLAAMNIYTA